MYKRVYGADTSKGVYVTSCQPSAVSSTVYVHILGAKTGFDRKFGWGQVMKRRGSRINIWPKLNRCGTYKDKLCN